MAQGRIQAEANRTRSQLQAINCEKSKLGAANDN